MATRCLQGSICFRAPDQQPKWRNRSKRLSESGRPKKINFLNSWAAFCKHVRLLAVVRVRICALQAEREMDMLSFIVKNEAEVVTPFALEISRVVAKWGAPSQERLIVKWGI